MEREISCAERVGRTLRMFTMGALSSIPSTNTMEHAVIGAQAMSRWLFLRSHRSSQ